MKKIVLYLISFVILSVILCDSYDYMSTGQCTEQLNQGEKACKDAKASNTTFECCYFEYKIQRMKIQIDVLES